MAVTENDLQVMQSVSIPVRTEVMYTYLCRGYNMQEVAEMVLHDHNSQAGQRVSNIMRGVSQPGNGISGEGRGEEAEFLLKLGSSLGNKEAKKLLWMLQSNPGRDAHAAAHFTVLFHTSPVPVLNC